MAQKETYSNFVVYGKFEVRDPHTKEIIFSTGSSTKIHSLEQATISGGGHMVGVSPKDHTNDLRELINTVLDERENIKKLEEEQNNLALRVFMAKYSNNPKKYTK